MDADQAPAAGQPPGSEQASPYCYKCDYALYSWYHTSDRTISGGNPEGTFPENDIEFDDEWPSRIWENRNLELSAKSCQFCQFILTSLDSSPWIPSSEYDYVKVERDYIGIVAWATDVRDTPDINKGLGPEFHYRLRIRLFRRASWNRTQRDYTSDFTHILPFVQREKHMKSDHLSD
ncbi:hypothetical protein BS50DRAFT_629796 [Corynespora cassiicola Philippines]|uniref:Uncharacterized protein n=1 Tax=Corynespora cassiicola Philippines TaxID=1448308 RepID=A0A2T2P1V0_CORCC|nr:hypothetical protein BS50DRAFT_629796 [Corynespora cassiicola Philippines]